MKKITVCSLLLLMLGSCATKMTMPPGTEGTPETAPAVVEIPEGKTPLTLVWIPSEDKTAREIVSGIDRILDVKNDMRLVAALNAATLNSFEEYEINRIKEWCEEGRLEVGLLPKGNLPIPLLTRFPAHLQKSFGLDRSAIRHAPDSILSPYETSGLLVHASDAWKKVFSSSSAAGFVLPLGLFDADALRASVAADAPWVVIAATGPSSYFSFDRVDVYAARPASSDMSAGGIFVSDENYSTAPDLGVALEAARRARDAGVAFAPLSYWKEVPAAGPGPKLIPNWGSPESVSFLWGSQAQERYWKFLAQGHQDLSAYQNSGKAKLPLLDELWSTYYTLLSYSQVSRFQDAARETLEGKLREENFRATLSDIYSRLSRNYPISTPTLLSQSLWQEKEQIPGQDPNAAPIAQANLRFEDFYDGRNSSGTDIKFFAASWTNDSLEFYLDTPDSPSMNYQTEIYIDLNQRPYEGNEKNYHGNLKASPQDYWEYLLQLNPQGEVAVYRYQTNSGIRLRKRAQADFKYQDGRLVLKVPRSWIAGRDPARWSWAVCAQRSDDIGRAPDCVQTFTAESGVLPFFRSTNEQQ